MTATLNFEYALPEIVIALAAMALLIYGVFRGEQSVRSITWIAVLAMLCAGVVLSSVAGEGRTTTFGGQFVIDGFAVYMKWLALIGSSLVLLMSTAYNEREKIARFEYPVLILFATLGMMMMISANDLMALYIGLELQSLALYVIAAFHRDSVRSSESGLKYFVLGALSSGLLLYGASLVYGFAGTTGFEPLAQILKVGSGPPATGLIIGLVFVLAGLAFKVSAVPFHMWTPDVYEGAPTPVTAFFAVAPKIAAIALLLRVVTGPFGGLVAEWQQIVVVLSIASMVLGAFAAIHQTNIKRLLAYSSIGHVGYALVGLAAGTETGLHGVLVYMTVYLVMSVGTFGCVLCMCQRGRMVEGIDDLAGLAKTQPMMALVLAIFMFSMAGIPPLAGFFGKLYVFLAAIEAELYTLAVIGVLSSVLGAFYYLRIVKLMYFDEPQESFDRAIGAKMRVILVGTGLFTLFFFIYPAPILTAARTAAAALAGG